MLTINDGSRQPDYRRTQRRELLRIGSLGLAGLSLPQLLAARASGSESAVLRDKSVVLLFLQGGPSHIELFDPKLTAPAEIRSITGEVATRLPGVTFGGTFPRLASLADRLTVVRSYASGNSSHTYGAVASGGNTLRAAMGAVYARVAGSNDSRTGIPENTLVLPEAVAEGLKLKRNFETQALPTLTDPGALGTSCAAFDPSGGGPLQESMRLSIGRGRLDDRRALLGQLDRIRRTADASGALRGLDQYQQQAFDMIVRGIARAFDLKREDPETIRRYDTSQVFRNQDIQRYGDMRRSTNLLGRQMLLARRLCEAGCGFVTVSDCGWDMHANNNSPKNMQGIYPLGHQVDQAVAAFIEDLHARGLQEKILLVVTGEMGRTPRINKNGGRDHYGALTSLLFAGGGLNMGQVVGQSDRHATRPATERYGPANLMATIMHTLFDVGELRLQTGLPNELIRTIESGRPIPGLL